MPIVGLSTAAVKTGMSFDAAMSQVQAISKASGDDFDRLRDKAREMGAKTKFSATEAAQAMFYMAMAGWDTEKMLNGIEGVMNLAAASGESLASTSDIVTDALTAFKLEAKDSSHFSDVLAATAGNANTNVALLGESFQYVATTAGSYGFSAEDVAIALGLMANAGVKGAQAGNNLKNALVNMTKPTEKQAAAMEKLGLITVEYTNKVDPKKLTAAQNSVSKATITLLNAKAKYTDVLKEHGKQSVQAVTAYNNVKKAEIGLKEAEDKLAIVRKGKAKVSKEHNLLLEDENGNVRSLDSMLRLLRATLGQTNIDLVDSNGELKDFDAILQDASKHGADLNQIQKLQAAATIFGKQNMAGMLAIVNASQADYDKLSSAIRNSTYNLDDMGQKLKESGVDWQKYSKTLKSATSNNFAADIADTVAEALRNGSDLDAAVQVVAEKYGMEADEAQKAVNAVAGSVQEASGTAEETAKIMNDNLSGQLTILKSALQELSIQISDALRPSLRAFVENVQGFVENLQKMDDGTRNSILKWGVFLAAIGPVLTIIGKLTSGFGLLFTAASKVGAAILTLQTQATLGVGAGAKLAAMFSTLASGPVLAVIAAVGVLAAAFVHLWKTNEEFRNKCIAIWEQVKTAFKSLLDSITYLLDALKPLFETVLNAIKVIWEGFCNFLAPILEGALTALGEIIEGAVKILSGIFTAFAVLFTGDWNKFWEGIKSIFEGIWESLVGIFKLNWTVWSGLIKGFFNVIAKVWEAGWYGIKAVFEMIWNMITAFFSLVWDGLKAVVVGTLDVIASIISSVFSGISKLFTTVWDGIKKAFCAVWDAIKDYVKVALLAIGSIIDAAFKVITTPFMFIWENCKEYVEAAWDWIKDKIGSVLDATASLIESVWTKSADWLSSCFESIKDYTADKWNWMKDKISSTSKTLKDKIVSTWETTKKNVLPIVEEISEWVSENWDTMKEHTSSVSEIIKDYTAEKWKLIRDSVSSIADNISTYVSDKWRSIKDYTVNLWDSIKDYFVDLWDDIKNSVTNKIQSLWDSVKSLFTSIWGTISSVVEKIKNCFKFDWELPKIKLPHFKIKGEFSLSPPSVPSLSIDWYKKAMNDAYILNNPTIFGAAGGKLLGGGEAGSEAVVGTNKLMDMITAAVSSVSGAGTTVIPVYIGQERIEEIVVRANRSVNYRSGGR